MNAKRKREEENIKSEALELIESRSRPIFASLDENKKYLREYVEVVPQIAAVELNHIDILLKMSTHFLTISVGLLVATLAIDQPYVGNLNVNSIRLAAIFIFSFSVATMFLILARRSSKADELVQKLNKALDASSKIKDVSSELHKMRDRKYVDDIYAEVLQEIEAEKQSTQKNPDSL